MTPIEKIAATHIPTTSSIAAIQHMRNGGWFEKSPDDYKFHIVDIAGAESPTEDERELNYTFRYVVASAIENPEMKGKELVAIAHEKAVTFIKDHQYVFAQPEVNITPKLDAAGNPKPKKGKKKEDAIALYNIMVEENNGEFPSRQDAIERFMNEIGMTKGGASTYVANCKKNFGRAW